MDIRKQLQKFAWEFSYLAEKLNPENIHNMHKKDIEPTDLDSIIVDLLSIKHQWQQQFKEAKNDRPSND